MQQRRHLRRLLAVITLLAGVSWSALPGLAALTVTETGFVVTASDFFIPRPADHPTAAPHVGVERLRSSDVVPAEYVGQTCTIVVGAANGSSVHGDNYGVVRSNGDTVLVEDTEDQPFIIRTTQSDRTITLGSTITISNVMVKDPDGKIGTSVHYEATITCTPANTTTTTTPSTSSTTTIPDTTTTSVPPSSSTSTTLPTTTSTTIPVTSTTVPTESTTTTLPTPSTSVPVVTTTTIDLTGSTTSTTVPPVSTPSTLPFTGPEDAARTVGMAMAGTALLLLGGGVLLAARPGK